MALKIWLDDELVDEADAKISVFDHSGILNNSWEIFRCFDKHVRHPSRVVWNPPPLVKCCVCHSWIDLLGPYQLATIVPPQGIPGCPPSNEAVPAS